MGTYKLIYFNAKGRAEPARYMFKLAGVEFEDFRIELNEWAEWKPKILLKNPMGKLPILEVDDDVRLYQSNAINRYLARELGFGGLSSLEDARIDIICETLLELLTPLYAVYAEKDEEKKREMLESFTRDNVEPALSHIETLWKVYGRLDYLVGNKLSLADVYFFTYTNDIFKRFFPDFSLDGHPDLKTIAERVRALPQIKKWLEERPVTER